LVFHDGVPDGTPLFFGWAMPTVMRICPYRFFFFSADRDEPADVHVERDKAMATFWLEPRMLEKKQRIFKGGVASGRIVG